MAPRVGQNQDLAALQRQLEAQRRAEAEARRLEEERARAEAEADAFEPTSDVAPVAPLGEAAAPADVNADVAGLTDAALLEDPSHSYTPEEAARLSTEVAALAAAHADDPAYLEALYDKVSRGLKLAGMLLADSANGEGDATPAQLDAIVAALDTVVSVAPPDIGADLAESVAAGVENHTDLGEFDNAFYKHFENTGSTALATAVLGQWTNGSVPKELAARELAIIHADSDLAERWNTHFESWPAQASAAAAHQAYEHTYDYETYYGGFNSASPDQTGTTHSTAFWAADFVSDLTEDIEAHKDDPAYVEALLAEAQEGLEKAAAELGGYGSMDLENSNGVLKTDLQNLFNAFSDLAEVVPPEHAMSLAHVAVEAIGEGGFSSGDGLYQLDDAWYDSTRPVFGALMIEAAKAQRTGTGDAIATELEENYGDFDLSRWAGDRVEDMGALAEATADAAYDWVAKPALRAAEFLKEQALDLANFGPEIAELGPGDTFAFGGSLKASLGLGGKLAGDIQVTHNDDGTYTVSAAVDAELGAKFVAGGKLGAGGRMEFTFDNAADAEKGAEMLLTGAMAAGAATVPGVGVVAAQVFTDSVDTDFLMDNISAIEVSAGVGATFDASFAAGTGADIEATAWGKASYRIEFRGEEKEPFLVRSTTMTAEASVGLTLGMEGIAGGDNGFSAALASGAVSGEVTVESAIPIGDFVNGPGDALQVAVMGLPPPAPDLSHLMPNAETNISASLDVGGGVVGLSGGVHLDFEVLDVDPSQAWNVGVQLAQGDIEGAMQELPSAALTVQMVETTGGTFNPELQVLGQGLEFDMHNTVTNYSIGFSGTFENGSLEWERIEG